MKNRVDSNVLSFIDDWVAHRIVEKYGVSEKEAIDRFLMSKTYAMLADYETALYLSSPEIIFDLWETEQVTGDPRRSVYIREDAP